LARTAMGDNAHDVRPAGNGTFAEKEKPMKVSKYVSSFLVGFTVGAGIALMIAPMPGKKMQRKVADFTDQVTDKVDDLRIAVQRVAS
jgi:YtxH-like protein